MPEKWPDAGEIIKKAAGGSLLRGTLHKVDIADGNEYTITRRHLLAVPKDVVIRGPTLPMKSGETTFTSNQELEEFEQAIEKTETHFGAGFAVNAGGCSIGTGVKKGKSKTEDSSKSETHKKLFASNIKYVVVPVASCQFDWHTLKFSKAAYESIKEFCYWLWENPLDGDLEMLNSKEKKEYTYAWGKKEKYNACANFFENFGSHVNVGLIHLGGILIWKSVFSAKTSSSLDSIKTLVSKSLEAHVKADLGLAIGGCVEISASKHKQRLLEHLKFKEEDISKTTLSCTAYGGTHGATSTEDWQNSLTYETASWSIIDRGDRNFNDHIGVWDILKNDEQFLDFYQNYHNKPISKELQRRSSTQPERRRKEAGNSLYTYFKTWIYRKNIRYTLRKAEENQTSRSYIKALKQIMSENNDLKTEDKETRVWLQFLQEDDSFQKSVLKLPNLHGITAQDVLTIFDNIEILLEYSTESCTNNKTVMNGKTLKKEDEILQLLDGEKKDSLLAKVETRVEIRKLLKEAAGKDKEEEYLSALGKLKTMDGTNAHFITEWTGMLSLDDGISDALLRPEQKGFMTDEILKKVIELTEMGQESTYVSNLIWNLERLNLRTAIDKLKEDAMHTDGKNKYLDTLHQIHLKVKELEDKTGSHDDWRMILEGDKNMIEFLCRPDPDSDHPIKAVKGTCKVIRKLVLAWKPTIDSAEKNRILEIIKQNEPKESIGSPTSKVCSIV